MATTVDRSSAVSPHGIMAPPPRVLMAGDIKKNQKILVRLNEPVFVFVEQRIGSGQRIEGLNTRKPMFKISASRPPEGVALPRTLGSWYRIECTENAKVGKTDNLKLVSSAVVRPGTQGNKTTVPFKLEVGDQIFY